MFHKIFPDYELEELQEENNYEMMFNESNSRIIQSIEDRNNYKIILQFQENLPK